jgi:hypothetical protein
VELGVDWMERKGWMGGYLMSFFSFYVLLLSLLKIGYPGCPFSLFFLP